MNEDDRLPFLRRALELAERAALEFGSGGPFGAVIVRDGRVIAEGMNRVVATRDPTWHAEIEAIRQASTGVVGHFSLAGCTLYSSAEPCPMCMAAACWARLDAVYYVTTHDDARRYGGFDDGAIAGQLASPPDQRIPPCRRVGRLHAEGLDLWARYRDRPGRTAY